MQEDIFRIRDEYRCYDLDFDNDSLYTTIAAGSFSGEAAILQPGAFQAARNQESTVFRFRCKVYQRCRWRPHASIDSPCINEVLSYRAFNDADSPGLTAVRSRILALMNGLPWNPCRLYWHRLATKRSCRVESSVTVSASDPITIL